MHVKSEVEWMEKAVDAQLMHICHCLIDLQSF